MKVQWTKQYHAGLHTVVFRIGGAGSRPDLFLNFCVGGWEKEEAAHAERLLGIRSPDLDPDALAVVAVTTA